MRHKCNQTRPLTVPNSFFILEETPDFKWMLLCKNQTKRHKATTPAFTKKRMCAFLLKFIVHDKRFLFKFPIKTVYKQYVCSKLLCKKSDQMSVKLNVRSHKNCTDTYIQKNTPIHRWHCLIHIVLSLHVKDTVNSPSKNRKQSLDLQ